MEFILRLLAVNESFSQIPPDIHRVTEDYLCEATSVGLLSNNLASWSKVSFPFPIVKYNLKSNNTYEVFTESFILDIRDGWSSQYAERLVWNTNSKFVVVIDHNDKTVITDSLITVGFCHVLIVAYATGDITLEKLTDPCKGIGGSPTAELKCKANASFVDIPPNILYSSDCMKGYEGMIVQTTADHLRVELKYWYYHAAGWGHFDPPSGLEGDIGTGTSLLGFGALYPFVERAMRSDVIVSSEPIELSFAVPDAAGPAHATWFVILVSELSLAVWLGTLLVYLLLIPISALINNSSKVRHNWALYNLALLIGNPQRLFKPRSLVISIIFFGFIITSHYQSIMSSKLTAPTTIPDINTLKELADSNLTITGPGNARNLLKGLASDSTNPALKKLSENFVITEWEIEEALFKVAEERNITFFRQTPSIAYHAQQDRRIGNRIHIVAEPTLSYHPVILFNKNSCLLNRFNQIFRQLSDSGLTKKWFNDAIAPQKKSNKEGPKKLAIEHIKGFLFLLAFGWVASFIAFLAELRVYYKTNVSKKTVKKSRASFYRNKMRHTILQY